MKKLTSIKLEFGWIKEHAIEIIAVIAAIIAAYYGYKAYKDNQPPRLRVEIIDSENFETSLNIDVDNICFFQNFYIPFYDLIMWNSYNTFTPNGIPHVFNNSSKTMKDFRLTIHVVYTQCEIKHVCGDYKIIKQDTLNNGLFKTMDLEYKSDVLYAQTEIPVPFSSMSITKFDSIVPISVHGMSITSDSISNGRCAWVRLCYRIAFDGIPEPKEFEVNYYSYFDEYEDFENYGNPEDFEDKYIELFLKNWYSDNNYFQSLTMVSVLDKDVFKIVNPPKKLTDEKLAKFQKDFAKDFIKQKQEKMVR